jgi:CheY-like chemotaxis protein
MTHGTVLVIDNDPATTEILRPSFAAAGVDLDSVTDGSAAMECLTNNDYCAVVLDPMIRHRLNGYAVLNFIEQEQPEMLQSLFLLTGMSEQTIRRTAPAVLPRLFRKPHDAARLVSAILANCRRREKVRPREFGSVLIVEDDHATATLLRDLVGELGYSATIAASGREALACLHTTDFDAILLDLVMPDVDGFAMLEQLRVMKPYLVPRVIVATGMPVRYITELDGTLVCAIVQKPVDLPTLRRLLRECGDTPPFEAGGEFPQHV